jgi:hypothetical protein
VRWHPFRGLSGSGPGTPFITWTSVVVAAAVTSADPMAAADTLLVGFSARTLHIWLHVQQAPIHSYSSGPRQSPSRLFPQAESRHVLGQCCPDRAQPVAPTGHPEDTRSAPDVAFGLNVRALLRSLPKTILPGDTEPKDRNSDLSVSGERAPCASMTGTFPQTDASRSDRSR